MEQNPPCIGIKSSIYRAPATLAPSECLMGISPNAHHCVRLSLGRFHHHLHLIFLCEGTSQDIPTPRHLYFMLCPVVTLLGKALLG